MNQPVDWEIVQAIASATNEAREVIRQLHEAQRDLRASIKEAKQAKVDVDKAVSEDVLNGKIGTAILRGLESYDQALTEAIKDATEATYDRFDLLAAICLGEDFVAIQKGQKPTAELIKRYLRLHPEILLQLNSKKAKG
jgi:hypothetical protein